MAKIIFDPSTVAKSADVNANFAGTWNGTLIDDGAIHKRHLDPDAVQTVRSDVQTSTATLVLNSDLYDIAAVTAQAASITIGNPTGSPVNGKGALIRIKDNGTARAITWGNLFREIGVTKPVATVANKTIYVSARYNTADTKWDILAVGREA